MTLLNYHLTPDCVAICSDTLVSFKDKPWSFASKLLILPHAMMVLGHRGPTTFPWAVADALEVVFYEAGIDGMIGVLPSICQRVQADLEERHGPDTTNELAVAGWSPSAKAFTVYHLVCATDFEPRKADRALYLSPWTVRKEPMPMMSTAPTDQQWIAAAEEQRRMLAVEAAEQRRCSTVGGDLLLATLSRAGIGIRKLHRFSDYGTALAQARERHRGG